NTETSSENNIFTTSSIISNTSDTTSGISNASITTLYTPVMKSSGITNEPFIPSYLKDTFVEKLQNSNRPLCLPTCFKEYSPKYVKCMDDKLMVNYIGIAFEVALNEDLFPIVGMRTRGECVKANFGMKPFKFHIDSYAKAFFSETRVIVQGEDILNRLI
ncbi:40062_t:CDS:2, partial [Gigaspora margarita]